MPESTTTEGAPVAEGGGGQRHWKLMEKKTKKTTETEAHSPLVTAYACTVPSGRFLAKFGCQPIKLNL